MAELAYQGLVYNTEKKVPTESTYKNFETLEFNVKLPSNQCISWNSFHIYFLIQIKGKTNNDNNIDATML